MLSSKNFKIWLSVFVILLVVVFLVLIPKKKKTERNFKRNLVELRTSDIDKVSFQTPTAQFPTSFVKDKSQGGWNIEVNGKTFPADTNIVKSILKNCVNMRSLRVAGNDKDKWARFQVADTNAVKVQFYSNNKEKAFLYIGNFSYLAQQSQNAMMANQGQGRMTTYVREKGDKKTHSVDGYLKAYFTDDVKYYRNKTIFKVDKTKLTRFYAEFADGTKYDIRRTEPGKFSIDGKPADSLAIAKFLHSADNVNSRDIVDGINPGSLPSEFDMIRFEAENMKPVTIKAYYVGGEQKRIFTSTMNPGAYFGDPIDRIYRMVFKPRSFYEGDI